jgi:hypothetical protein
MIVEHVKPDKLAKDLGWSSKRLRALAKRLGACAILGNRMILLPRHVDTIIKAVEPCPSNCLSAADIGITGGRLPVTDYEDRLAQRREKSRRVLQPRLKDEPGNVVLMDRRKS